MRFSEKRLSDSSAHVSLRRLRQLTGRFSVQLMLRFLVIIVLLALVVSILFSQSVGALQRERQSHLLAQQAESQLQLLESRANAVEADALLILSNTTIQEYLTYPYSKPANKVHDALYAFQPLVRWVMTINTQYKRIHFLTTNDTTAGDTYVNSLNDFLDRDWVQQTIHSPSRSLWQSCHTPDYFRYTTEATSGSRVATYTLYHASGKHMIVLDTAVSWLYQDIPIVVDTASEIVLFSALQPDAAGTQLLSSAGDGLFSVQLAEKAYYARAAACEKLGVTLLACAEQGPMLEETNRQTWMFIFWSILFILVALVLLSVTSGSVVRRMSLISRNVSRITGGNYDVSYASSLNDEIDDLGTEIVSMARQMDQMVNQRLNQQMLLQEAEFRALQQQINPHFIFNILQTMQMMAEVNDQTELADMIAKFGRMVRYNLYAAVNVSLSEELENVRDYLMLQKILYNDELEMTIDMESTALQPDVPRLILQPLVENAVLHGRIRGKILHVSLVGRETQDGFQISISNDGALLSAQREQELQAVLEDVCRNPGSVDGCNAKNNLALINIQKRLLIRFGSSCRLHITNTDAQTVLVFFTIPREVKKA